MTSTLTVNQKTKIVPILTIIIGFFNNSKIIKNALNSCFANTTIIPLYKILIINDGSNDDEYKILCSIVNDFKTKTHCNVKIVSKQNGNWGSNINFCAAHLDKYCQTKYIKILDADDQFISSNLAEVLMLLRTTTSDIVIHNMQIFSIKKKSTSRVDWKKFLPEKTFQSLNDFHGVFQMPMAHTLIFKTTILKNIKKYPLIEKVSYADAELSGKLFLFAQSYCYFNIDFYSYHIYSQGQTVSMDYMVHQAETIKQIGERLLVLTKNKSLLCSDSYHWIIFILTMWLFIPYYLGDKKKGKEMLAWLKEIKEKYPQTYSHFENSKIFKYLNVCLKRKILSKRMVMIAHKIYKTINFSPF